MISCMKTKGFLPQLLLLVLPFASCSMTDVVNDISEALDSVVSYPLELKVADNIYTRDFYNTDLYYNLYAKSDSDVMDRVDDRVYYRIPHSSLSLLAYTDSDSANTQDHPLYCRKYQLDEAKAYYKDGSANWDYYCGVGTDMANRVYRQVSSADAAKFDALIKFCRENRYEPFKGEQNTTGKKVNFPMPSGSIREAVFYKQSRDGLLCSSRNDVMCILGGKLYLIYYYDFDGKHDGADAKVQAVALPDEYESYFRGIATGYGL